MPFTLSHPAAVAPFWPLIRRNQLPLCALAIGTMSPDFEYLWRLRTEWKWSHAPLGVLDFCLPVGLLTVLLWVALLRTPTRQLLALPATDLSTSASWWARAAVAIVLGATTHLVWDGFTHGFAWASDLVPALRHPVRLGSLNTPVFNLLQQLSTAIGGLIVLRWLIHELRSGAPEALLVPWRLSVFAAVGGIATAVAIWNALRAGPASEYWTVQVRVAQAAVGGLLGLAVSLVAYATIYRMVAPGAASRAA